MQFCDDQTHLQSPVSQMNITDNFMSQISSHSLDTLTDDCRTQMSDMQWFCNVWSTVVKNHGLWILCFFHTHFLTVSHLFQILRHICSGYFQINESRINSFCHLEDFTVGKFCHYIIGDHDRGFMIYFCTCHSTITLIFTQVRPIRQRNLSHIFIITGFFKSGHYFIGNQFDYCFHTFLKLLC